MSGDELPEGWCERTIEHLAEIRGGIQKQPMRTPKHNAFPYLRVANVLRGRLDLSQMERMELFGDELATYRLQAGDLLIVEGNGSLREIGRSAIWSGEIAECVHQNHIIRVRPSATSSKFLDFYLNSAEGIEQVTTAAVTTSGLYSLSTRKVAGLRVPVAPLPEQHRIVEKVESLLADVNASRDRLSKVIPILKRFRQAVLAAACSGRLTEDWRDTFGGKSSNEGLIDGEPLDCDLLDLPSSWNWARMEQLADIRGGIQKQPKRAPKENAYPYLRVANVLRGRLSLDQIEFMELFGDELSTYRLEAGDLLIVEGNGSLTEIGRSAVWSGAIKNCVHQNHIIRVRSRSCSPQFLDFYWNSPIGTGQVAAAAVTTSGLFSLSTRKIAALPVPVPPLEEQAEIVRRVESLFALADAIEARLKAATARADKLPQAILSKAFRGELVPTEAELARAEGRAYETAEEMLERVKASSDKEPAGKAAKKPRGRAAKGKRA